MTATRRGAICTADWTVLSSPLKFTVEGPPLTASFESVPTSHNGSDNFKFRIAFSEELETNFSYKTLRDHAFTVEGGRVVGARRLVSGSNIRWEVSVRPDSNGDVTITLPATTDCDAQGASAPTATRSCPAAWITPSAGRADRPRPASTTTSHTRLRGGRPSLEAKVSPEYRNARCKRVNTTYRMHTVALHSLAKTLRQKYP